MILGSRAHAPRPFSEPVERPEIKTAQSDVEDRVVALRRQRNRITHDLNYKLKMEISRAKARLRMLLINEEIESYGYPAHGKRGRRKSENPKTNLVWYEKRTALF